MIMNSQQGLVILERARLLFIDLDELKKTSPTDATAIAAFVTGHIKSAFGSIPELLSLEQK